MDAINPKATIKALWLMSEKKEIKWNCKKIQLIQKKAKKEENENKEQMEQEISKMTDLNQTISH